MMEDFNVSQEEMFHNTPGNDKNSDGDAESFSTVKTSLSSLKENIRDGSQV